MFICTSVIIWLQLNLYVSLIFCSSTGISVFFLLLNIIFLRNLEQLLTNSWNLWHMDFVTLFFDIGFGDDTSIYFPTQDRSPKTQSQVRRMIEAGQMDQRARHPPSPSSSPLISPQNPSSNTSNQKPAVEKSESVVTHKSKLFNSLSCYKCGFHSFRFYFLFFFSLSSGGLVENSFDNRRSNLLQFPGGSWDGVPGLQKG